MTTPKPFTEGCCVCGSAEIKSLGLCNTHYQLFKRRRAKLASPDERAKFEADCAAKGWIRLGAKRGRPLKGIDPFADIAASVTAEGHANIDAALAAEATKRPVKKKATKRKKSG